MAWHHASRPAGAVLKKRFDDIFDSARYTKALDVLNKQKKGLASKAKDISGDLKGLHADKVAAQDHLKRKASAEKAIQTADASIKACDDKQASLRDEKSRISDKMRKLQAQEQGLQECRAEVDGLERSLKYLEERLADSALMDEDDDVLAATAPSCVENYSRLAISAPRPWFQLKLGHDLRGMHSTVSREQHLTQTTRDPRLKHKLNFDFHTGQHGQHLFRTAKVPDGHQDVPHGAGQDPEHGQAY